MASLEEGGEGADRPGWHHPGVETRIKLFFCGWIYKEHQINDVEDGSGEETTAKKVIAFHRAMTKKVVSFFFKKNRVTPSVAAPGDTNPRDATEGC